MRLALLLMCFIVVGCTPENEHFCAKYSYFYDELSEPGLLPYRDIKQQLEKDIKESNKDRDRLMLMVLEDKKSDVFGYKESASEYCLRAGRWKNF